MNEYLRTASVLFALFVNMFCLPSAVAQTAETGKLSFKVKDGETQELLTGVTCQVLSPSGKLTSYGISDQDGNINISFHKNDKLTFSFLGYKTIASPASNFAIGKVNIISMKAQAVTLKEVAVKVPPIRMKSDTLIYDVNSFKRAGDRHLEDVLKKLPGISVADNGSISYQGKSINKFYIEGKDLLGYSYGQATKNMPIDAVSDVEVLENHQPIKMLHNKSFSDHAAINIKLDKNHKVRPFGEIKGGIGKSPTIWDNSLFLMQVMSKNQLLISGKMNNTGTDISSDTKEHIDVTDIGAFEPVPHSLFSFDLEHQSLSEDKYLQNKSYTFGINYLYGLSNDATLRCNVLWYDDHSTQSHDYNSYYGGANPVTLNESSLLKNNTQTVLPILKYEFNGSKKYISDELRYSFTQLNGLHTIESNGTKITEDLYSKPYYFQNYFNSSFFLGKLLILAKSFVRYFDRRESINDASDDYDFYNVAERYSTESFVNKNVLKTSVPLFRNNLGLSLGLNYHNHRYDYTGSARNQNTEILFTPSYSIKYGRNSTVEIAVPAKWNKAIVSSSSFTDSSRGLFSCSPSLFVQQTLTNKMKLVLNASKSTFFNSEDFYSQSALRTGYRTLFKTNNDIFKTDSYNMSMQLNYKDLAYMFFSNISISYSDMKDESYTNYEYTDTTSIISAVSGINHRKTFYINAMADKTFSGTGVTLKTELNYNINTYRISQSSVLTDNHSHVLSAKISSIYQKLDWLRLALDLTGNLYWNKNDFSNSDKLSSLITDATVYFFPNSKTDIIINYQNSTNEISQSKYKTCNLFDVTARYRMSKQMELGLKLYNLFNTKSYTTTDNSGLNVFRSSFPLRGRQILFNVMLTI